MGTDAKAEYVMGFDLGGTKLLAAVLDRQYNIVGRKKRKTKVEKGAAKVFKRIVKTIRNACEDAGISPADLAGIGVGSPGPLDPYKGIIIHTPNLGFKNFALKDQLEDEFGVPVVVDNDVNVGTYGEFHFGAGKGKQNVVGIFPGTGVGGGLVLNGKIYRGSNGSAGEIGHMIIQADGPLCGCGQRGCVEAIASKGSLAKEAIATVMRGRAPTIKEEVGTDITSIRSKVLSRAFAGDDPDIREIVTHAARYLGIGMANIVNILNPDIIVLGGGLIEAMPREFVDIAEASMREHAMAFPQQAVKVCVAKLGDDAVLMGGAKMISEEVGFNDD